MDQDEKERYTSEKELRDKVDELFDWGIITRVGKGTKIVLIGDPTKSITPFWMPAPMACAMPPSA